MNHQLTIAPSIPYIPDNAPFTPSQRAWLNGFLAGMFSGGTQAAAPAPAKVRVNVLFGSESGNSESLSKKIAKTLNGKGYDSKAMSLDKFTAAALTGESFALIVTSTFGDGEPPASAKKFHADLHNPAHPRLENLSYSILALGDTNYEKFCQCGKDLDVRLEALGAKRLYERVDCNVDYDEPAGTWQEGVFAVLETVAKSAPAPLNGNGAALPAPAEAAEFEGWSRKNPFPAKLVANRKLNGEGSAKEVRHYEISLEGSGLHYVVGDALGVLPQNCPEYVADLLAALGFTGDEPVPLSEEGEAPIREALLKEYDITKVPATLLKAIAERSTDKTLADLLIPSAKEALGHYLWGREIIDLLLDYASVKFTPPEFVSHLKKLQARLYSISSSINAFPGHVHLTVAAVRYESFGRKRKGICSTFLADRADGAVPVFIQESHSFRLPQNGEVPIIMVGPGTGVAPFRAFLHDRKATGAKGGNWLFFGDQRAATDFYYQDELDAMMVDGFLTKLSTAFSRDQMEKIYVQTRMLEEAAELWKWLEQGAHFYVCGDASRMAKDVDAALHKVCETAGGLTPEAASEYITKLKNDKRYQRDVY
ncbi:MAG: sulfite reductase subunit alpha [Chthoniobacteraceae bacterium]